MKLDINNYPGGKSGSGVAEWIINHVPQFDYFIEGFAGSASISFKLLEQGLGTVIIFEKYEPVWDQLHSKLFHLHNSKKIPNKFLLYNADTVSYYLEMLSKSLPSDFNFNNDVFYFDPPYLKKTRKSKRNIYGVEWMEQDHVDFLSLVHLLSDLGAYVIISHYDCELYNESLPGWHTDTMQTMTRSGVAEEKIYMNYDIKQLKLATPVYVGKDRTDRQRIKRKINSLRRKIKKLPPHEKQLFDLLSEE